MAAFLFEENKPKSDYYDKTVSLSKQEYETKLLYSTTVYVGNLSIYTKEESIYELFSQCGEIKDIKMGINQKHGTPIGFCFVEFYTHEAAGIAVEYLTCSLLYGLLIRVDWDAGFQEGRQYGRGKGGYQWRDCFRTEDNPERPKAPPAKLPGSGHNNYQNNNYNNNYRRGPKNNNRYDKKQRRSDSDRSFSDEEFEENHKRKNKF